MKFDITVLLDRSGSMQGRKDDHIGGIRSFVNDQKGQGETDFTFIQFDSNNAFELVLDGVNIESVDTDKLELVPRGGTPLLDAMGKTIAHIESRIKGKEKDTQVVLMIVTDGEENSSREWKRDTLKKAVESKDGDWKILYLGANLEAFQGGLSTGITMDSAIQYANTAAGTAGAYHMNTGKLNSMRSTYARGLSKSDALMSANYTAEDRATLTDTTDTVDANFGTNGVN